MRQEYAYAGGYTIVKDYVRLQRARTREMFVPLTHALGFHCHILEHEDGGVVRSRDDKRRIVYAVLDNEPLNDYAGKLKLGSELAISFDKVREHKKASEFKKK